MHKQQIHDNHSLLPFTMPVFVEDPSQLSKARLKSDLIAHNVALPPAKSKKEVYVELHTRHVDQKNGADFSSDEEQDQGEDDEEPKDAEALDPSYLTDDDLRSALLQHGVKAGPIVASTRAVYERKLRNLLLPNGHSKSNGKSNDIENCADEAVLYSDSEKDEDSDGELEEPDVEEPLTQAEAAVQSQQSNKQSEDQVYPRCFLISSRLRVSATKNRQPRPKQNLRNVLKSSQQTQSRGTQIPSGISSASSIDPPSGLATGLQLSLEQKSAMADSSLLSSQNFSITEMVEQMESRSSGSPLADASPEFNESTAQGHWSRSNRLVVALPVEQNNTPNLQFYTPEDNVHDWRTKETAQEPVPEIFKDLVADKNITPSGIYATRRRPIKGAAGRPVQYVYPDTPVSPTTSHRLEVEKRLVPLKIQILVFLIVAVLLYVIYVCVEDYAFNPFLNLLDVLNQGLDSDETGTQEVEELLELE